MSWIRDWISRLKGVDSTEGIDRVPSGTAVIMTEEDAKRIIRNDPDGNIYMRIAAINYATSVLGEDCTMEQIWKWAEGR